MSTQRESNARSASLLSSTALISAVYRKWRRGVVIPPPREHCATALVPKVAAQVCARTVRTHLVTILRANPYYFIIVGQHHIRVLEEHYCTGHSFYSTHRGEYTPLAYHISSYDVVEVILRDIQEDVVYLRIIIM